MTNPSSQPAQSYAPVNVLLSREELLLISRLLKREILFGVEPEPLGDLTPEQQAYGLVVAERALRARELAQIGDQGNLLVQNDVLNAVGVCAYAQQIFVVSHLAPDGRADRLVGYSLEEQVVTLTNPFLMLHRLVTLPDRETLLDELVKACLGEPPIVETTMLALSVSGQALTAAREAANKGDLDSARKTLNEGKPDPAADALAEFLSKPHSVSVLHVLTLLGGDNVAKQEVTVTCGDAPRSAWLMVKPSATEDRYDLSLTNTARLREVVKPLFAPPLK